MSKQIRIRILSLLLLIISISVAEATPKILVSVYVKGLRSDLLDYYRAYWGDTDGLNKLMGHSFVAPDISYDYTLIDGVATLVSLSSGTTPEVHGVIQGEIYDTKTKSRRSTFTNNDYRGINSSERLAPVGVLQTELLCDVLRNEYRGNSIVYAIANDANDAIAIGGHDSEAALWIDRSNGLWATSNFYGGLPALALKANSESRSLKGKYAGTTWQPLKASQSKGIPNFVQQTTFSHNIQGAWEVQDLKASPFANDAIVSLASDFISYARGANRGAPSMISMVLSVDHSYHGVPFSPYSSETFDAYRRLSTNIGQLQSHLDKTYGAGQYAIAVIAIPSAHTNVSDYPSRRKTIEFDPDRCIALSNLYLSAIYGRNDWVVGYGQHALQLNRKEIEDKKINIQEISNNLATFVSEMKGVIGAIPASQLQISRELPSWSKPLRSLSQRRFGGDVLIAFSPSTSIKGDPYGNILQTRGKMLTPFILHAPNIKPQRAATPIAAADICPTLALLLQLRLPLSAEGSPIFSLFDTSYSH